MPKGRYSLEAAFTATDKFSRPLARMQTRMTRFTRKMKHGLGAASRFADRLGRGLSKVAIVATAAGAAAGLALRAILKPAMQVEDALAKVGTVVTPVGETIRDALARTEKAAIEWSKTHVASATEFIDANYNMASAGLDATQAIAGTKAALTLATATMGDAATSGNLLATVYNNMGDKAADAGKEMTRISDIIAKTQAMFQIKDLGQLNEGFKLATPSALQFGVSLEQLSTALGAMNSAGLQGSMAGTAFAASMRQMQKASKALGFEVAKTADGGVDFFGALRNIEGKFGSFADMSDKMKAKFQQAFGDEGLRGVSLLLGKSDDLAASLAKVANSAGAAAAAEKTIESTGSSALKMLRNRVDAIRTELGKAALPAMRGAMPELDKAISGFGEWVQANKPMIEGFFKTTVSAVVRLAKAFGGSFMTTLEAVGKSLGFMSTNDPRAGEQWIQMFESVAKSIGQVAAVATGMIGAFVALNTGVTMMVNGLYRSVVNAVDGLARVIAGMLAPWIGMFEDLSAIFRAEGLSFGDKALKMGAAIVRGLVGGIEKMAMAPVHAIKALGKGVLDGFAEALAMRSPSKKMEDKATQAVKGLERGFIKSIPNVERLAARLAIAATPRMDSFTLADVRHRDDYDDEGRPQVRRGRGFGPELIDRRDPERVREVVRQEIQSQEHRLIIDGAPERSRVESPRGSPLRISTARPSGSRRSA